MSGVYRSIYLEGTIKRRYTKLQRYVWVYAHCHSRVGPMRMVVSVPKKRRNTILTSMLQLFLCSSKHRGKLKKRPLSSSCFDWFLAKNDLKWWIEHLTRCVVSNLQWPDVHFTPWLPVMSYLNQYTPHNTTNTKRLANPYRITPTH